MADVISSGLIHFALVGDPVYPNSGTQWLIWKIIFYHPPHQLKMIAADRIKVSRFYGQHPSTSAAILDINHAIINLEENLKKVCDPVVLRLPFAMPHVDHEDMCVLTMRVHNSINK